MLTLVMLIGSLCGYSADVEGYDAGTVFVGIYTPSGEYGYAVRRDAVYLDTVYTYEEPNGK